jgi:hypothetical protein
VWGETATINSISKKLKVFAKGTFDSKLYLRTFRMDYEFTKKEFVILPQDKKLNRRECLFILDKINKYRISDRREFEMINTLKTTFEFLSNDYFKVLDQKFKKRDLYFLCMKVLKPYMVGIL